MHRSLLAGLLLLPIACHGYLGGRTTEEDQELHEFAEARQRASTYYDGGDFERASTQFKKALDIRPDHIATQLGYAYSLMFTKRPSNLLLADEQFKEMGEFEEQRWEVKRTYGMAITGRTLAVQFERRARINYEKGQLKQMEADRAKAREYAHASKKQFERIIEIDTALAAQNVGSVRRVSASLAPDAHAGIAHCLIVLADSQHTEYLDEAIKHIQTFADIAANARKFWLQRRERVLVLDPLRQGQGGDAQSAIVSPEDARRYEERIVNTVEQEVAMRRALLDTYLYLNRYQDAIQECNTILSLDPDEDETYFLRGRAYALLEPPNYRAAISDLKDYRSRQDLSRLTEELVGLNRRIKTYEKLLAKQNRG